MRTPRLSLFAATAAAALLSACASPTLAGGFEVRNHTIMKKIAIEEYKAPDKSLGPVKLIGVRNGIFAGQVVVLNDGPINEIKVVPTDLTGPGTIPAKAVQIRYGVCDGAPSRRRGGPKGFSFDSLEEVAPKEVKRTNKAGQVIQPVWIRVKVPKDAKAGDYSGKVTISAAGAGPVAVTVNLKVVDYTLPDPVKYHGHLDIVQSPESVALAYGVKMWSKKHLALLDKTFAILGEMGQKTLYISAVRRTHFGNEHATVRWFKDKKGELQPNFDNVEKYLAVATRHLGKVPGVVFYCWEPVSSMGHASGTGGAARTSDRPVKYTLWDPKTSKLKKRTGPAWGTPESKKFWKKFTDGVQPVLKKHGMEKSMLFGLIGDARPTKMAMDDITNGVKNANWAVHSHHYAASWQGYNIGMGIALWGIHLNICDPQQGHGFGWKADRWLMYYPREFNMHSSLAEQRYKMEMWMGAFSTFELKHKRKRRYACGLGRIGGDFWRVLKDARGRLRSTLAGRYPESYWGQLNLNYCIPYILGKGKNGPLPTVRSEAFREGNQDVEVRVFVEKAIEMPEHRAKLGEDLAKRIRTHLDARIRLANRYGGARKDHKSGSVKEVALDWQKKNEKLYKLASEVAKKLGVTFIEGRGKTAAPKEKK